MVTKVSDNQLKRNLYTPEIAKRINGFQEGMIFVPSDFKDIADRETIKMALSRLCESKQVRRLARGIYDKPEYNQRLKEYIKPSPGQVAKAIARNYGWTIVPDGETALNLTGLSTQVPNVWHYVSDGPYKKYQYDDFEIHFKHTTNKELKNLSPKSALIVQAIKALGEKNIDPKAIAILSRNLSMEDRMKLMNETMYATSWIYKTIKMIAKAGESNV